ncbi:chorismate-binding protein [Bifidobacterium simiarum]|nr:chorismate-binding protein [Bifidobacterium simiarum]
MSPGGSITGTPKRRATEIIAECERSPRDVYTGSQGYVGTDPGEWLRGEAAGKSAGNGSDDCAGNEPGNGSGRETDIRPSHTVMHTVTRSDSAEVRPVCDLSIIIRAAICEPDTVKECDDSDRPGRFDYMVGAGGGVTLDSDPAAEYDEAVHKARAVLDALGAAAVADTLGTGATDELGTDADSTTVSGTGDKSDDK